MRFHEEISATEDNGEVKMNNAQSVQTGISKLALNENAKNSKPTCKNEQAQL